MVQHMPLWEVTAPLDSHLMAIDRAWAPLYASIGAILAHFAKTLTVIGRF